MSPAPSTARKKKTNPSAATSDRPGKKRQDKKRSSEQQPAEQQHQTEQADQSDQADAAPPLGARIRARLGQRGAHSVLVATRVGLMFFAGLASYLVAMFAAVSVIPNVFLMVASGSGVGPASPLEMQLAHWLTPSLFLNGLIFVLVLVVVRWLWRAQRRLGEKARRSLQIEETGR